MPRLHHPGNGNPPFDFEYGGVGYVCHPPDQRWEVGEEEYEVVVEKGRGGEPNKNAKLKKQVWVKAPGLPRKSFLDLTDDQAQFLRLGQYLTKFREYGMKWENEMGKDLDHQLDAKIEEHKRRLAEVEAEFNEKKAALEKKMGELPDPRLPKTRGRGRPRKFPQPTL